MELCQCLRRVRWRQILLKFVLRRVFQCWDLPQFRTGRNGNSRHHRAQTVCWCFVEDFMGLSQSFCIEQSGYFPGQESPGIVSVVHEDSELIKWCSWRQSARTWILLGRVVCVQEVGMGSWELGAEGFSSPWPERAHASQELLCFVVDR